MDALPIHEANDVAYRSTAPGVMHACGHDAHVAIGLAVARRLAADRGGWRGTVKFAFQPAEEGGNGALAMIEDGVLENPHVDAAFGLHVMNNLPIGQDRRDSGPDHGLGGQVQHHDPRQRRARGDAARSRGPDPRRLARGDGAPIHGQPRRGSRSTSWS